MGTFIAYTRGHVLCIKDGVVEDWTNGRQHRIVQVLRVIRTGDITVPVAPAPAPRQPRATNVKQIIHNVANRIWEDAGRPSTVKEVLVLRKAIMNHLERNLGVKRTTASSELGNWQKSLNLV